MRTFELTKNTTPLQMYKAILQCETVQLEQAGIQIKNERLSENYSVKAFVSAIKTSVAMGLVSRNRFPDNLVVSSEAGEHGVLWHAGHKLSQLIYKWIVYADNQFIICASTQSASLLDSSFEVMFLTGDVVIDSMFVMLGATEFSTVHLAVDTLTQSIILKDGGTLYVDCDATISAMCPIVAQGAIKIVGKPGTVLHVDNVDIAQPCIGGFTNVGLEYGKWSESRTICKGITVDGVNVVCTSIEPAFMLGEYGTNNVPNVITVNGGTLDAVEVGKTRVMVKSQTKYLASAKYDDFPIYEIRACV